MIESLISKAMIEKSKTITAILERKTADNCYFKAFRYGKDGRHEYSVIYKRDNDIALRERLECSCIYCSSWNVLENRMCSYKLAAIQELIRRRVLKPEVWKFIESEGVI